MKIIGTLEGGSSEDRSDTLLVAMTNAEYEAITGGDRIRRAQRALRQAVELVNGAFPIAAEEPLT